MMQPELPWNVAGIPSEAREAARAAARREGLSVGEWLTRRILRGLADGGDPAGREDWLQNLKATIRAEDAASTASQRDTEDMLARVSRSENETHGAYRRIEDQLGGLARRLEATERSHSESSRAMSKAAAEINVTAREQAQAFDQLGSHVSSLGDRLTRVERSSTSDGVKDAVKGLHAGLSRLADQIADTANQSATQIAALAGNIESVAGKLHDVRGGAEYTSRMLSERIAALDDRLRAAERVALSNAEALEKAAAGIVAIQGGGKDGGDRHAEALTQLTDTLDKLATRLTTGEAQTAGAIARLEEKIEQIESRQTEAPADRRLQGIEHALSDIMGRLDNTERNTATANRTVEENLRNLSIRIDTADKRNADAIAGLHNAMTKGPLQSEQAAPSQAPPIPATSFDLPPFPDTAAPSPAFQHPASEFDGAPPPFAELPPMVEPQPAFGGEAAFGGGSGFAGHGFGDPGADAGGDSFLSAARRSARAASEVDQSAGLGWGAGTPAALKEKATSGSGARFPLLAGILIIALGAILAGILLSRGIIGHYLPQSLAKPQQNGPTNVIVPTVVHPAPTAPPPKVTAPGSPVVPPQQAPAKPPNSPSKALAPPATLPPAPHQTATAGTAPVAPASSFDHLTQLARAGSAKAELLVGLKYVDGDGVAVNEAEAAKWLERAANQGEAVAAYRLGTLYERGHGVPADATKAMQWYLAAAKLGNRKAMHNLAVFYAEGTGTPKDMTQAAQWFSKAAALGLADSQFNLAVLYERGLGVQQSLIDAYKWYAIAAAQGDQESKTRLAAITTQLTTDERAAAGRAAAEFHAQPLDRNANAAPDAAAID